MEKQRGYCSYQINIMKLALALVVIKRKPAGISAKEYATRLAVSFSQVQENWKTKCAAVEKELIYVRQKLLEMTLEKELESTTTNDVSSQPMESQSQGYYSYTQPQLLCENTPHGINDESRDQQLEDVIRAHTSFINKMSTIGNIKKKLSGVTHCDAKLIIKDTFVATVKALQEQETVLTTLPSAVITNAVDNIIGIMKNPIFGECKEEMIQCTRQLLNKYITKLSGSFCSDFWNKEFVEMLCTVILNLSAVTELTEGTVTVLVEHIRTCFKMLSDSLTDITVLKPSMLDFTAKAFSLLESILKQCQPDQLENLRDLVLNEDGGLPNQLLEQYPLFTYSLWRISAVVNARCNQCV